MVKQTLRSSRSRLFTGLSLGIALTIAACLSPWASQNPDGLDRVARDQGFEEKAPQTPLAQKLPFYQVFDEYKLRGVPEAIATPLAGVLGTLTCFGVALGLGKVLATQPSIAKDAPDRSSQGKSQVESRESEKPDS